MTSEEPALTPQDGLEAFAALAAHQLGEAIALMRGAAAVLELQRGGAGAGEQDALRALNAGGDRAQRYVDDLLDVARAAADPEGPAPAVELDLAFDAAAAELESFLSRVPVDVQREPLPRAALESREAQRLFLHLLRSALAAGATRLGLTGRVVGDGVVVELFDNGTPVEIATHPPTDSLTRPFEPFAPPRGRGVLIGAGVSLSVCRRIVERRGGRIAMRVRADGATIVTVHLPAAAP